MKDIEEVETSASIAGWNILGGDGANMGMIIMKLKPWDERSGSEHRIDNVIEKIEERVSTIKTGSMFAYALPTVTGYGFSDGIELYVQDYEGGSIDKLKEVTDRFAKALGEREEIARIRRVEEPDVRVLVALARRMRRGGASLHRELLRRERTACDPSESLVVGRSVFRVELACGRFRREGRIDMSFKRRNHVAQIGLEHGGTSKQNKRANDTCSNM